MDFNPSEYRVALLAGGRSGEREVSLTSGKGVFGALEAEGFQVTMLDPASSDDLKTLVDGGFDVAFLVTHGRYGEDGVLQGFLELIGLPYTGSGVLASALAMNKSKAKDTYTTAGVPTPPSITLVKGDEVDVEAIVAAMGEHVVIKAANEGSTIGIYMAETAEEIAPGIASAFEHDDTVVVEKFVAGREFTIAIFGNDEVQAFPVIEIIPQKNTFYDYESKYAPGGSKHVCPAELEEELAARMQQTAIRAHHALGCRGVSRTDFIVEESGDFWVLETNTLPGMTPTSLLPDAARAVGISYNELCKTMVKNALGL
ncbi:MAG: D-alanine--D-alanine ligase [Eggerthellaceae bacterium]|nr:D-alanine--D-alanine ligase [Eggerthellaceae bacterium]